MGKIIYVPKRGRAQCREGITKKRSINLICDAIYGSFCVQIIVIWTYVYVAFPKSSTEKVQSTIIIIALQGIGEGGASCHKIHKQTSIKYSEPVSQKQILS